MEVIHAHCGGIDVHKRQITVCVRIASGGKVEEFAINDPRHVPCRLQFRERCTEEQVKP